jgi:DNA-binding NarL/FixJ family response regulator
MSAKGEMTVREMGRLGGKARADKTTARQRRRWAGMGGKARAARYTPEELRAFAANAGRRPYKLTPTRERRILQRLGSGWTHPRLAEKFGISLRTVGRIVRQNREKDSLKDCVLSVRLRDSA